MMLKKVLGIGLLISLVSCNKEESTYTEVINKPDNPPKQVIAFPGAEGFGMYTTGGRGGNVYIVTKTTDDNSEGTLRYAVNRSGARHIVFATGGTIELNSELKITNGDVTIAGQTAPGDGVTISGYPVIVEADNVIIRFIRFRMGDETKVEGDALGGRFHQNILIDHCSMSWSTDECVTFYANENLTVQWCLIAESLKNSVHGKGAHGYGGIWGGKNASFHHNLLAHHDSRNPRFDHPGIYNSSTESLRGVTDFSNNVIYNWGNDATYGGEAGTFNVVNNYYKPGPAANHADRFLNAYKQATSSSPVYGYGKFYVSGNVLVGYPNVLNHQKLGVEAKNGTASDLDNLFVATPFEGNDLVTITSADEAYTVVCDYGGCSFKRDPEDLRIIGDVKNGTYDYEGSNGSTNGIIDSQTDVGGWPQLDEGSAKTDSDQDGMPDDWEMAKGLNPQKANPNDHDVSDDYENIEMYMNSLVDDIIKNQMQ